MFDDLVSLISKVDQMRNVFLFGQLSSVNANSDYIVLVKDSDSSVSFLSCKKAESVTINPTVGKTVLVVVFNNIPYIVSVLF